MEGRLLIVVPEAEEPATREVISELAVIGWEKTIHLTGGPVKRGMGDTARAESQRIIRLADNFEADCLIVTKEICCEKRMLEGRQDLDLRRPAVGHLRKKLKDELDQRGLRWRRLIEQRLALWDSRKTNLDDWLKQFDQLGHPWVGEAILRQVDVIGPEELWRSFELPAQARLGANWIFSFVLDQDQASSSNRIGAVLTKLYGSAVNFASALSGQPELTRIAVCEDALWTGTEVKNLCNRFQQGGDLEEAARGKQISFRHCVVSDYGIWACRHYMETQSFSCFLDLWLGERQRFVQVLRTDLDEKTIRSKWHLSPQEFDEWLSAQVKPLAFQDNRIWKGRQLEAQGVCEQIGVQLIEKYASDNGKTWSDSVRDGFALGAGRFGSTLAFAHSLPKVCLPLLWLSGQISFGSGSLQWRPLFYDARRAP